MLQQLCDHVHNHFIKAVHEGSYEIADAMISLPFLLEGQRFLIRGSMLNDGMYTYHSVVVPEENDGNGENDEAPDTGGIKNDDDTEVVGLHDETFAGTICALAVPPAVIALSAEMKAWVDANGAVVNSPYTSEDVIGVYSYTKGTGGSGAGGAITVYDAFKDRLSPYRKVADEWQ